MTGGKVDTASLFPGSVDDVWAFQGALDDSQVSFLNIPWDLPTEVPPRS
ncbi:hypothetical protein [Streptomyces sp. CLI2509]